MGSGLFSSSSSSTQTTMVVNAPTTTNVDKRAAAAENSTLLANYGKGNVTLNQTMIDASPEIAMGAIEGASEVAKNAFSTAEALGLSYASTARGIAGDAFDFAAGVTESIGDLVNRQAAGWETQSGQSAALLEAVVDLGKTTATGGQSDTNKTLLYAMMAMAGLAGLFIFARK